MSAAAGSAPEPFSWAGLMHAGLCRLRLHPDLFWRLTPVELAAATGAFAPEEAVPARNDLAALMAAYPDAPSSAGLDGDAASSPFFAGEPQ
ncbi:rcc01693 family protein [Rhizobium rhizosphaerae]|nr:rcc01693 family protein [Xaviernesmea rhizosphaerae]